MGKFNINLDIIEFEELYNYVDLDGSGDVSYNEFFRAFNWKEAGLPQDINPGYFLGVSDEWKKNYMEKYGLKIENVTKVEEKRTQSGEIAKFSKDLTGQVWAHQDFVLLMNQKS
jgi:hypothetical protein